MKQAFLLAVLAIASFAFAQNPTKVTGNPVVDQITNHSVEIRWTSTAMSPTEVNYGTDPNNLSEHQARSSGSTEHDITLEHLQPKTTYYYEIPNRYGESQKGSFTTH